MDNDSGLFGYQSKHPQRATESKANGEKPIEWKTRALFVYNRFCPIGCKSFRKRILTKSVFVRGGWAIPFEIN